MKKQNKGMIILLVISFLLVLVDLAITLSFGNLTQYLEINPLYSKIGLGGILLLVSLIYLIILWRYNHSKTPSARFYLIVAMVTSSILRIFIIIRNYRVLQNPPSLAVAQAVTTEAKKQAYLLFVNQSMVLLIPFFVAAIAYWFFSVDHVIVIKSRPETAKKEERAPFLTRFNQNLALMNLKIQSWAFNKRNKN